MYPSSMTLMIIWANALRDLLLGQHHVYDNNGCGTMLSQLYFFVMYFANPHSVIRQLYILQKWWLIISDKIYSIWKSNLQFKVRYPKKVNSHPCSQPKVWIRIAGRIAGAGLGLYSFRPGHGRPATPKKKYEKYDKKIMIGFVCLNLSL